MQKGDITTPGSQTCACTSIPWAPHVLPTTPEAAEPGRAPYQPLLAHYQQPAGPTALGQPHFLIEGTVAPGHHCDLVGEVFYRNVNGGTELRRAQVSKLQERLRRGWGQGHRVPQRSQGAAMLTIPSIPMSAHTRTARPAVPSCSGACGLLRIL